MLISKFDTTNIAEKIADLQCQYGIELPEQYRQFLHKYNGGETLETSFRLARVSSDLSGFFGLGVTDEYFQIERYFDCDEMAAFVSEGIFPIGKNSFGDLLFITAASCCNSDFSRTRSINSASFSRTYPLTRRMASSTRLSTTLTRI